MVIIATLTLTFFVMYFLAQAYWGAAEVAAGPTSEMQSLQEQKERCLQVLKDLELDFQTQKVSPEEFERMGHAVKSELAGIYEKIDAGNV